VTNSEGTTFLLKLRNYFMTVQVWVVKGDINRGTMKFSSEKCCILCPALVSEPHTEVQQWKYFKTSHNGMTVIRIRHIV